MKLAQVFSLVLISAAASAWITSLQYGSEALSTESDRVPSHKNIAETPEQRASGPGDNCLATSYPPERGRTQEPTPQKVSREERPEENQAPEVSLDQLRHQESQVNSFRENIAALEGKSPLQAVKREYKSQPVSYQWAMQKEEQLLSLFESQTALEQYAPLDVSCRSKTCQVVMAAGDEQQGKAIYNAFLKASLQHQSGKEGSTSVSYFNDPKNGQLVMYTSEDDVGALFGR